MTLNVTLNKNSAKKGKYRYNNGPEKEIQNQSIPMEKDKPLLLWLYDEGKRSITDSKLSIEPERYSSYFEIKPLSKKWQLKLLDYPPPISALQGENKEPGHNHGGGHHSGCFGEPPKENGGPTVTIGEP